MKLKGFLLLALILSISLVSAIDLEIEKKPINDVIISELDKPAVYSLTIKNNGERDSFEMYSLVSVDIEPKTPFSLSRGETKEITIRITPSETIKKNPGVFSFVYKIKGFNTGTQEDILTMDIVNLKDALQVTSESINPDSKNALITIENLENFNFENIDAKFSSVFFSFSQSLSLESLESTTFTVPLDSEKLSSLMAGSYILTADLTIDGYEETLESTIKFLEKSGISTDESEEGFFIKRVDIEKRNDGNLPAVAEITIEKNTLSRAFTTFSLAPSKTERTGMTTSYYWAKELRPGESLNVVAKTNWIIPIVLVIAIVVLAVLSNIYLKSDLKLTKKISQVRTKGGEFALKVTIHSRARKYIEKINVVDKLPPIVKLYKRYGTIVPDKIDEKNRRLEWNIESLNEGEDRILSYIIYSKIGVVGRFELPPAKAIYEKSARIKETRSNRVFFVSEPGKKLKEE